MSMQQGQYLRQTQQLSTYMYQAGYILSLSSTDLFDQIQEIAQNNPAICLDENFTTRFANLGQGYRRERPSQTISDIDTAYEAAPPTLQDVLRQACQIENFTAKERVIAEKIISSLDNHGFLNTRIAHALQEEFDKLLYTQVLKKVQQLDPVGCATKNTYESLYVQMQFYQFSKVLDAQNLEKFFKAFSKKNTQSCQKILQVDTWQDVEHFVQQLRTLSPYPASGYATVQTMPILPDFKVFYDEQDVLRIQALHEFSPLLSVDPNFKKSESTKDKKSLISKELKEAQNFLEMIEYREHTVLKMLTWIVSYQKEFFKKGLIALRALSQKQLANALNLHEATISRAIQGRYIQTPHGIFRLKDFFSPKVKHEEFNISKTAMQCMIREILTHAQEHLSDEKITQILNKQGYKIARRTVTKYRNQLTNL